MKDKFTFPEPLASDITPLSVFSSRRKFIKSAMAGVAVTAATPAMGLSCKTIDLKHQGNLTLTDRRAALHYNNYYEFSTAKDAVSILSKALTLTPWKITIKGEVEKPLELDIDSIRALCEQERVYRFRCVEGWSMVVPWLGISLGQLLSLAKPLSSAKYVKFIGCHRPEEMIGQRRPIMEWPYTEALRIDEAMHPLSFVATGMYGEPLSPQNGAPLRLVVPWKYGYKSIKAFESIEFVSERPVTSWMKAVPSEYGFYANVNPSVSHPRWSQRREIPLGQQKKQETLLFNGYEELVSSLYVGLDLKKNF